MISREEVIWGYRCVLGREPETDAVIDAHAASVGSFEEFRAALLRSDEFAAAFTPFQHTRWVAAPVFGGQRLLWINLQDRYVSLGCLHDAYELTETNFLRSVLKAGDTFLDVGANVGWYAMLASLVVGEAGAVHAFEPRAEHARHLQLSVDLNGLGRCVTVHPFGLSDRSAAETLIWSQGTANGGASRLWRGETSGEFVKQDTQVRRLDDLGIARVDVIKIDIEGAEMLAIDGAAATLDRDRPIVLSEVFPTELERVSGVATERYFDAFLKRDYRAFIVDDTRLGEEVRAFPEGWRKPFVNIAFVPRERGAPEHLARP